MRAAQPRKGREHARRVTERYGDLTSIIRRLAGGQWQYDTVSLWGSVHINPEAE